MIDSSQLDIRLVELKRNLVAYDNFDRHGIRDDLLSTEIFLNSLRSHGSKLLYLKEIRRFRLWALKFCNKNFQQINILDAQNYKKFLQDLPSEWISRHFAPVGSPDWRPFSKKPTKKSINIAISKLKTFFDFLKKVLVLEVNPFAFVSFETGIEKCEPKALGIDTVSFMFEYLTSTTPFSDRKKLLKHRRIELAILLMYELGLRIGEVVSLRFSSFVTKDGLSMLCFFGKGDIPSKLKLTSSVDNAFRGYRRLDTRRKKDDFLFATKSNKAMSVEHLRNCVVNIFKSAAQTAPAKIKAELLSATPHSLRHSFASHLASNNVSLPQIQKLMRHNDINTTAGYIKVPDLSLDELLDTKSRNVLSSCTVVIHSRYFNDNYIKAAIEAAEQYFSSYGIKVEFLSYDFVQLLFKCTGKYLDPDKILEQVKKDLLLFRGYDIHVV